MVKKLITFPPVALALEMAHTYIRVGVARSAAALSYFLILTLFPMLLCVNYFIGLFHLDLEQLLTALDPPRLWPLWRTIWLTRRTSSPQPCWPPDYLPSWFQLPPASVPCF